MVRCVLGKTPNTREAFTNDRFYYYEKHKNISRFLRVEVAVGENFLGSFKKKVRTNKQTHPGFIPEILSHYVWVGLQHLVFSKSSIGDSNICHRCELLPIFMHVAATVKYMKTTTENLVTMI